MVGKPGHRRQVPGQHRDGTPPVNSLPRKVGLVPFSRFRARFNDSSHRAHTGVLLGRLRQRLKLAQEGIGQNTVDHETINQAAFHRCNNGIDATDAVGDPNYLWSRS